MEVGPPEPPCSGEASNHHKLLCFRKDRVVSVVAKRRTNSASDADQEGERKRYQPMKCRKRRDDIKTEAWSLPREKSGGEPAYCPGGVRHEGGASLVQAPVRNVGTRRPIVGLAGRAICGTVTRRRPPSSRSVRGRVLMRATGTDR